MEEHKSNFDERAGAFSLIEDRVDQKLTVMKDPVMESVRKHMLAQHDMVIHKDEVNVLILYTGGTFGMKKTDSGYKPIKDWLLKKIQSNKTFYDEEYSKLNHKPGTS